MTSDRTISYRRHSNRSSWSVIMSAVLATVGQRCRGTSAPAERVSAGALFFTWQFLYTNKNYQKHEFFIALDEKKKKPIFYLIPQLTTSSITRSRLLLLLLSGNRCNLLIRYVSTTKCTRIQTQSCL